MVLFTLDKVFAVKAMTHDLVAVSPTEYLRLWPCEQVAAGLWSSAAAAYPFNENKRESRWGPTVFDRAQSAVERTYGGRRAETDCSNERARWTSAETVPITQQGKQ